MRRWAVALLLLAATGCTNAPLADFLDLVAPAKIRPEYKDGIDPIGQGVPGSGGTLLPPQVPPAAPPSAIPRPPPADRPAPFSPGPITLPNM